MLGSEGHWDRRWAASHPSSGGDACAPGGLLGSEVKDPSQPGSGHRPSCAQIKPPGAYCAILGGEGQRTSTQGPEGGWEACCPCT